MSADRADSNRRAPAVVVGGDDVRGVYVARALSRHGIDVIGLFRSLSSPGARCRSFSQRHLADTSTDDVIAKLLELGPTLPAKGVLFPCFDTTVVLLARHREELEEWYHVMQPEPEVIELLMNKVNFYRYGIEHGLPLPTTYFLRTAADVEEAAAGLTFPCVVKPPGSKHPAWQARTSLKALKAGDPDELRTIYEQYEGAVNGSLIAQNWVEGSDSSLFACHSYHDRSGETLVTFTSRKVRQWPPHTGEVSAAIEVDDHRVREIATTLFEDLRYTGIGYVEIKRDTRTDEYFIIEPNMRVSGRAGIAEVGGVELALTMYRDALGLPLPVETVQRFVGARWGFIRKDVQSVLHYLRTRELSLGDVLRPKHGPKGYALWSWRDPGPFIADITRGIRILASSKERMKRDFKNPLGREARIRHGNKEGRS